MSFPYDQYPGDMYTGQDQAQHQQQQHPSASGSFPQWETLSDQLQQPLHSPLDTPGSGTLAMQLELDDMHVPSPIDNTPILLHHPRDNPPPHRQRHAPATANPLHPIDAVIFGSNRPRSSASAASTPPGAGPSTSSSSAQPTGVVRNPPRTRTASATAGASHPYYRPHTTTTMTAGTSAGTGPASSSPFMTPNPTAAFEPLASGTGRRGSAVMTRSKTKKQTGISATTSHGGMIERPPARRSTSVATAAAAAGASSSMPSPTVRQSLFGSTSKYVLQSF